MISARNYEEISTIAKDTMPAMSEKSIVYLRDNMIRLQEALVESGVTGQHTDTALVKSQDVIQMCQDELDRRKASERN